MDFGDGKLDDYIIDDIWAVNMETGMHDQFVGLMVWADQGLAELLSEIPGIHFINIHHNRYVVTLDPRYDVEHIKKEIEAVIVCAKEIE